MSLEHEILKLAAEIAERLQQRSISLEQEILDLEARITQKEAERDLASRAPKRLANFEVQFRGYYQCPACWIERETRSPLHPRTGADITDTFECSDCRNTFTISARI
jgi:hypothetical protein